MSKLINVSDSVYEKLAARKGDVSFSVVIESLLKTGSNKEAILACAGKGGIERGALKELRKEWKKWSDRYA